MPVEQYIKTKLPKDRLPFRELQSGGLAYMLGEPTYAVGGSVGHAPWHKPTGQPQPQGQTETPTPNIATRPDPLKAPRGIPSLAPKNMDPAYMQQQMMQKAMMGRGNTGQGPRPMAAEGGRIGFAEGTQEDFDRFLNERKEGMREGDLDRLMEQYERWYKRKYPQVQEAAEGGRIGFGLGSMSRRAFMKLMAGITGTGVAAGSGLLKFGKAAKVVPKVTETIARGADGMPIYITDLIEVVKAKGARDVIEGFKRSDYSTVHSYKGVDVIEEAGGNIKIKNTKQGSAADEITGKSYEGPTQETHMEITKGGYVKNKKGKMVKEGDEYFEGTVRPDMEGKMKDIIEEIDEVDHLELKKIADEIDTLEIPGYDRFSKASGGLAYMLGE
jgi:hypothetical protein